MTTIILPQITIQPTYPSVLSDVLTGLVPAEDIWVSCYRESRPFVHGKVRVSRLRDSPGGVKLESRGGVEVEWVNSAALKVSCPTLSIPPTLVRFPRQTIPIHPGTQITSLSPSPDLTLLATGSPSGSVTLTPLTPPSSGSAPSSSPAQDSKTFTPHLSTVLSVRILPSSQVLLSTSSDCRLQISPVSPPLTPARTLLAHKRGVTDSYIIHRGRQLVSTSKDGTARLWDVGAGKSVRTYPLPGYAAGNKLAGLVPPAELDLSYLRENDAPDAAPPSGGINGHISSPPTSFEDTPHLPLLAVALSSGLFTLLDLRTPSSSTVYTSPKTPSTTSSNALQSLALSGQRLWTGSLKGDLAGYDLRQLRSPLFQVKRNGSSLEDLVLLEGGGLAVATEDGLPYLLQESPGEEGVKVGEEWAGWECDAIRCLRAEGGGVWAGGDDGVVRRY